MERLDYRVGFDGPATMAIGRVTAPAPRQGLLAAVDQPRFSTEQMPPLPANVESFTVFSLDALKTYDQIVAYLKQNDPATAQKVAEVEQTVQQRIRRRFREDLLGLMGRAWAIFQLQKPLGGGGLSGAWVDALATGFQVPKGALVLEVKDANEFGRTLDELVLQANKLIEEQMGIDVAAAAGAAAGARRVHGSGRGRAKPQYPKFERRSVTSRFYTLSLPTQYAAMTNLQLTVALGEKHLVIATAADTAQEVLNLERDTKGRWTPPPMLADTMGGLPDGPEDAASERSGVHAAGDAGGAAGDGHGDRGAAREGAGGGGGGAGDRRAEGLAGDGQASLLILGRSMAGWRMSGDPWGLAAWSSWTRRMCIERFVGQLQFESVRWRLLVEQFGRVRSTTAAATGPRDPKAPVVAGSEAGASARGSAGRLLFPAIGALTVDEQGDSTGRTGWRFRARRSRPRRRVLALGCCCRPCRRRGRRRGGAQTSNNLKQVALAMHNFASANGGRFPGAAILSSDGKPLIELAGGDTALPGRGSALSRSSSWTSPGIARTTWRLLARMPEVYGTAGESGEPSRRARGCRCSWVAERLSAWGALGPRFRISGMGLRTRFWWSRGEQAVPWTKPADLTFDPAVPTPALNSNGRGAVSGGAGRWCRCEAFDETRRRRRFASDDHILGW